MHDDAITTRAKAEWKATLRETTVGEVLEADE